MTNLRRLVEFATLTIDAKTGLPVAHIFTAQEIDARKFISLCRVVARADQTLYFYSIGEGGIGKEARRTCNSCCLIEIICYCDIRAAFTAERCKVV